MQRRGSQQPDPLEHAVVSTAQAGFRESHAAATADMHQWSVHQAALTEAGNTHSSLELLSMLLIDLTQVGFVSLALLPHCILHPVGNVVLQSTDIALQSVGGVSCMQKGDDGAAS